MTDTKSTTSATPREELLKNGKRAFDLGGAAVGSAAAFAYRAALPLMALYAARDGDPNDQHGTTPEEAKARNQVIAKSAGTKALIELIEIASVTHPLYDGSTPYVSRTDGVYQAPHMRHVLSLAQAAMALFSRENEDSEPPPEKGEETPPEPRQSVAYIAVAPGEYQYVSGPLSPTAMRRSAMRERSYSQPELAMLARQGNQYSTLSAGGYGKGAMALAAHGQGHHGASAGMMVHASFGCGCGGTSGGSASHGCGCFSCGGGAIAFPPARHKEDGKCAPLLSISCDTKWRLRECFKQSLCDLLRCLGDQICDDGKFASSPDLGECLEGFVCSLVTCLPEAICPPPPPSTVCITQMPDDCGCNFAVGS